ncbi:hypothetical protein [Deinococcus sp. UR1]|uniref:hypothetical protein n=1 Tax=Deinococcus sp. UR1 TaxID=1704277 RepID=UPI000C59C8B0|nr:hypothetical protein [Deinococcus sp. UR1]PIG96163.1 hypothetical protein AMD26_018395 [Deinococcus sp. UR1]
MTGAAVPALLSRLEAKGARLEVQGGALILTGKRPPADLLNEVRDRKAEVLAWLTAPPEDPAPLTVPSSPDPMPAPAPAPGEVVTKCDNLPPVARGVPLEEARARNAHAATLPGHCGSCARAVPAPEWGPGMVTCACPPAAWRPVPPPLALHPACRCGAYLTDGEDVGRGWKARAAALPVGNLRAARPAGWDDLPGLEGGAA